MLDGAAVTAGLVDAHMHLESTKLWIDEFVRTVLPLGTTAVAADPHEIANVLGIPGVAALIAAADHLPFTFGVCASSCVPASPFESPGAELFAPDVAALLDELRGHRGRRGHELPRRHRRRPRDAGAHRHRRAAPGRRTCTRACGAPCWTPTWPPGWSPTTSAPGSKKPKRNGARGCGSSSGRDRPARTWAISSRWCSPTGPITSRCAATTASPTRSSRPGTSTTASGLAVEAGVSEIDALIMATLNPAEYHGFTELGALGPGYQADILCFDALSGFRPSRVFQRGRLVARDGAVVPGAVPSHPAPDFMRRSVHLVDAAPGVAFDYGVRPGGRVRTIGIHDGSLTTSLPRHRPIRPRAAVARLAVVERHRETGRIGLGLGAGIRADQRRARLDRRARCAQLHGRGRSVRTWPRCHGRRRGPPGRNRRGSGGGRRRGPRPGRTAAAHRRPDERSAGPRWPMACTTWSRRPGPWGRRSTPPSCI